VHHVLIDLSQVAKKDLLKTSNEGLALIGHQFSQVTHSWVIWAHVHQVGWLNYYKRVTF
jgi:hypothetical protein